MLHFSILWCWDYFPANTRHWATIELRHWPKIAQQWLNVSCLLGWEPHWTDGLYSVVILALKPRKSGKIANKCFMIYYGRYRSQLVMAYFCYKQTNFRNVCSNIIKEQYLGGWHCFTCFFFWRIAKFNMAAICWKSHIFTNDYVNCQSNIWIRMFEWSRNLNITK